MIDSLVFVYLYLTESRLLAIYLFPPCLFQLRGLGMEEGKGGENLAPTLVGRFAERKKKVSSQDLGC